MALRWNRSTSLRPEVHFAARRFENAAMGVATMAGKSAVGRNPMNIPRRGISRHPLVAGNATSSGGRKTPKFAFVETFRTIG